ncbi:MAG: SurA N-terminal domain-containing protein [Verrucomicrobiia bacterium]
MIALLRYHMRWLLILVAAMVIIAFVWLYNRTDMSQIGASQVARIYGRDLTQSEIGRLSRHFALVQDLGLFELLMPLVGQAETQEVALQNFIVNLLVLREEATRMQIVPTPEAIRVTQMGLPVFQTNGQFDPRKLQAFILESITPRGFTENQIDEAVADLIRVRSVTRLVNSLVSVSDERVVTEWRRLNQLYDTALITLPPDALEELPEPSPEEIAQRFEIRKNTLLSEPKRKVLIATLGNHEATAVPDGRARIAALQKLADQVAIVSQSLLEPGADFRRIVLEAGMEISETPLFPIGAPPESITSIPGAQEALRLMNAEDRNSDPLQAGDSFVLLHLLESEEARPLTLEEATPRLAAELRQEAANRVLRDRAREARQALQERGVMSDASREMLKNSGALIEEPKPFSLKEIPESLRESMETIEALVGTPVGQVSEPITTPRGVVLLAIKGVIPPDEEQFEKERVTHRYTLLAQEQAGTFASWLRDRREEAGLTLLVGRDES